MGPLASISYASTDDQHDQIDAMLIALQSGRIAFVSAIMRLRFEPQTDHHRVIRRAVVTFLRLQRLSEAAAELLDATP
jgi:hypothetical protein